MYVCLYVYDVLLLLLLLGRWEARTPGGVALLSPTLRPCRVADLAGTPSLPPLSCTNPHSGPNADKGSDTNWTGSIRV